jgi:transposase
MSPLRSLQRAVERLERVDHVRDANRPKSKMYSMEYKSTIVQLSSILNSVRGTAAIVMASAASISRWRERVKPSHRKGSRDEDDGLITRLMLLAIKARLLEHPCTTAKEIRSFLREKYNVNVSRQLVQLAILKRLNMSYKRTRKRGTCLADDAAFRARYKAFVHKLCDCFNRKVTIVSVDESGADARGRPLYGRAIKGQPAILYAPPVDSKPHVRTSLLMAIATTGGPYYMLTQEQVTGNDFADFVLGMPYPEGSVLLMDNHSMHNTTAVQVAFHVKGYTAMFLPPYCPELNPIEMMFGTIKTEYHKFRYSRDFEDVPTALQRCISSACILEKIQNYMKHVQTFATKQDEELCSIADDRTCDVDLSQPWKRRRSSGRVYAS